MFRAGTGGLFEKLIRKDCPAKSHPVVFTDQIKQIGTMRWDYGFVMHHLIAATMTDKELIDKIIDLYKTARLTTIQRKNVKRGRSHSVSSKVEDLFAIYIAELLSDRDDTLPDNIELLVDQPFTYHTDKTYSVYPDIAVIKDNTVIKLFDIKMDLGWNRDFFPFCKEKQELIEEIRGLQVKAKNGATKDEKNYTIDQNVKYNIVIVSNENISKKKRDDNERQISTLEKNNVYVFILTEDIHPNNYNEQTIENIKFRQNDLDNLRKEIKNDFVPMTI